MQVGETFLEKEPLEVHLKVFKPKQLHLQLLKEYLKVLSDEDLSKWEKREYIGREGEVSWIDAKHCRERRTE